MGREAKGRAEPAGGDQEAGWEGAAEMTERASSVPPGSTTEAARRNFHIDDYLQMCRDGEATFSISEAARVMGVSRMHVYRMMMLAEVSDEEFEEILAEREERGLTSLSALYDEVKRRTGRAREYVEHCPHCGGALRTRRR